MTFLNWTMLPALVAVGIPILIHLLNRRKAKLVDWGAMRFLLASLASRNRRIMIEEIILMVLRCLLVALLVLAVARPFLPSRSAVPWPLVLPAVLAAAICAAIAAAMWTNRRARWALLAATAVLAAAAVSASAAEYFLQSRQWGDKNAQKDVAIIIDGSMSMTLAGGRAGGGRTNFRRAVDEARAVVAACKPGDSVGIILAGSVQRRRSASPMADRRKIASALESLAPTGGSMRVLEAMHAATALLGEGHNVGKKIVLITDGQNVGWDLPAGGAQPGRNDARWQFLADGLKGMPTQPQIICRTLPLPEEFSNAAVTDIDFARKVVGTDRSVGISVKVVNTGTSGIRPSAVELAIDGVKVADEKLREILPNAAETARFEHRFARPGPHVITAEAVCRDDMPADNVATRVLHVIDVLPVLIVDGAPSSRPLQGAGDFISVALAPGPPRRGRTRGGGDRAADTGEPRYLVAPELVAAPDIAGVKDFGNYRVVILANVPMLPRRVADSLAGFVRDGGGLLIGPGDLARPQFYNNWTDPSGRRVCPAKLLRRRSPGEPPARVDLRTFSHPALRHLAEPRSSDADAVMITSYWKLSLDDNDADVRIAGLLDTGEPLVAERKLARGYVLVTAMSLDRRDSNLPSLKCFVPMLHEIVYFLASPMMVEPNVKAGEDATVQLPVPADLEQIASGRPWELITPSQLSQEVSVSRAGEYLRVSLTNTDEPGLYHLIPPAGAGQAAGAGSERQPGEAAIPLAVVRDASESQMTALATADFRKLRQRLGELDLFHAETLDEMTAAVAGRTPGEELWKYLVIGALLVLVGEITLCRWIATQRRLGETEPVRFAADTVDIQTFRTRAKEMLAGSDRRQETAAKS